MAVLGDEAEGSVSGGCVEGAVYELCQGGGSSAAPVLQRYGVSDDDAFVRRPDLRRHPGHLRRAAFRETFPELGAVAASVLRA